MHWEASGRSGSGADMAAKSGMKPKHHINDLLRDPGGSKNLALILLQRPQSLLVPTGATRQDRTRDLLITKQSPDRK
jgi:hypothetical protein